MPYHRFMHSVRTSFSRLSAVIMLVALALNILAPLAGITKAYAGEQDQIGSEEVLYVCTQAGFVAIPGPIDNIPVHEKMVGEHCLLCVLGGGALLTPTVPMLAAMAPIGQKQNRPTPNSVATVPESSRGINLSRAPPFIV